MTTTTEDTRPAYLLPATDVLATLSSDPRQGLSSEEARRRLEQHGPNRLPEEKATPAWQRFIAQFQNPLTVLLLIATVISLVAWIIEHEEPIPFETITILAIVILNAVLGFVQEARAEQAVAALQAMAAPHARVMRDGRQSEIDASEVVPGDIILIEEGDTIPADGRLVEAIALRVAESALTGESTSVSKEIAPITGEAGIGDQTNMVFSSTAVTAGRGRAIITATGEKTEIGKIAGTLHRTEAGETPLQKELDSVGKLLGIIVVIIAVVMAATIFLVDRVTDLADIVEVLLLAVSLAVAAVPEGLTAITTIVLSLGMQRMVKRNVIVRKLSSVETLGSTTVICTDKTGTLTKNEMTVRAIATAHGQADIAGTGYAPEGEFTSGGQAIEDEQHRYEITRLLRAAALVNNAELVQEEGRWKIQGDPTEGALIVAARKFGMELEALEERFPRRDEVPFTSERKMMTTAHRDTEGSDEMRLGAKGAPDVLLARCTHHLVGHEAQPLSEDLRSKIQNQIDTLAHQAMRTIGVAFRSIPQIKTGDLNESFEQELVWLGVLGMIDPPRDEARKAIGEAQQAGIRVIMITGDHPNTAAAIGGELGIIKPGERAITGAELQKADDAALGALVTQHSVFARVAPEHKLRIVQALKAHGEIAAMTGDGVNDAPALKTADIGVAMGITGTDVSKGAADMILTDDNFASIVAAVEEGRSIFANIQKFLRYLLSSNIGEVFVMFFGVVLGGLLGLTAEEGSVIVVPLLATQILWINLLTDSGPALALGLDPADHGVMGRPPRDPRSRVITPLMWFDIVFVGIIMGIGTLLVMDWSIPGGLISSAAPGSMGYARTMAFTTLVFFQLFNVFNARHSLRSAFAHLFDNMWLWAAVALSVVLQIIVIYTPLLQTAFGTTALSTSDWLICIGVGSIVLWLNELKKIVLRGIARGGKAQWISNSEMS
ncbi:cation-translocating P-type ATPase [Chloroflexia bacterium SDU3-3]|nr:cation-translocating P-type ATPase [Chloroflexia bacterium SDU3-3]